MIRMPTYRTTATGSANRRRVMIETMPKQEAAAAARKRVMLWSIPLWIGAGTLPGLNITAGLSGDRGWLMASLALTDLYALCGIGFGVWAARTVMRRP
jgi:hypothetical protein